MNAEETEINRSVLQAEARLRAYRVFATRGIDPELKLNIEELIKTAESYLAQPVLLFGQQESIHQR